MAIDIQPTIALYRSDGMKKADLQIHSLDVTETLDFSADSISISAKGDIPVVVGDTVRASLTDTRQVPAQTKNFGTYEVIDSRVNHIPVYTTINGNKVFDHAAFVDSFVAFLDSALSRIPVWSTQTRAAYPIQTRWEDIIHPSTATDAAPHLLQLIKDAVLEGEKPSYSRVVNVLKSYAFELRHFTGIPPSGTLRFTHDGENYGIVPINQTVGTHSFAAEELVPYQAKYNYKELADNDLMREIEFSVPVRASLPTDALEVGQSQVTYSGGTVGPKVVMKSAINPYEGVIALEGERLRRLFTNQELTFSTALRMDGAEVRNQPLIPSAPLNVLQGKVWKIIKKVFRYATNSASIDYTCTAIPVHTDFHLQSPEPFNGTFPPAYTVPGLPSINVGRWSLTNNRLEFFQPDGNGLITADEGGRFTAWINVAPTESEIRTRASITKTTIIVKQGTEVKLRKIQEGRARSFLFKDGIQGTRYTVEVTFANNFGEGPTATQDIMTLTGGRPIVDITSLVPKIVAQQAPFVLDEIQGKYAEALGGIPTDSAGVDTIAWALLAAAGIGTAAVAGLGTATLVGIGIAGGVVAGGIIGGIGTFVIIIGPLAVFGTVSGAQIAISVTVGGSLLGVLGISIGALIISAGTTLGLAFIAAAITSALLSSERHGAIINAGVNGNGYRILRIRVQGRSRDNATANWGGWDDAGSGALSGSVLQVEHSNDAGTLATMLQDANFSDQDIQAVNRNTTKQGQYRVAAITSVNEGIQNDDAQLEANQDWSYSRIFNYRDFFHLWVDVVTGEIRRDNFGGEAPVLIPVNKLTGEPS